MTRVHSRLAAVLGAIGFFAGSLQLLGAPAAEAATAYPGLQYGPASGAANQLDVYVPSTGAGPFPALLLIHGGGWTRGDKSSFHKDAAGLAKIGIVGVPVNYRLAPKYVYPAQLDDLQLASSGMEFASEMLIRGARIGLRIEEIETGYRPRVGDSKLSTWSDGWRHLQLILMLAPDVVLIGPGLLLLAVGLVMLAMAFVRPEGIQVGSLLWQPVFFSGIGWRRTVSSRPTPAALTPTTPRRIRSPVSSELIQRAYSSLSDSCWSPAAVRRTSPSLVISSATPVACSLHQLRRKSCTRPSWSRRWRASSRLCCPRI